MFSAARFTLRIRLPSREWVITPQSMVVNRDSSISLLRISSSWYSRSRVTSMATPTVPMTEPSMSYRGDL